MWISRSGVGSWESGVGRARISVWCCSLRHSRRCLGAALTAFCCLLLTAYYSLPAAYRLIAAGGRYAVLEVKPNVFVWMPEDIIDQDGDPRFSRAANSGFILTTEGVVVVNTTNTPFHARELLYEIRRRTDQSVMYVVNTGSEADETLGNEVFADLQANIISTPVAQAEIRGYQRELVRGLQDDLKLQARMRGIHPTAPNQTFEPQTTMRIGGHEVRLLTLGNTASSGDSAVHLPDAKVLFLGDLYDNGYFPQIGSHDVRGWIEALRQVETWDVEVYIPGHGVPSGKKELVDFRQFLEWLMAEVRTRVQEGKTLDQVKSELLPFANYHWHAPEIGPPGVEAVYQQLAGARQKSSRHDDSGFAQ